MLSSFFYPKTPIDRIISSSDTLEQKNISLLKLFKKKYDEDLKIMVWSKRKLTTTLNLFRTLKNEHILKLDANGNIFNTCYLDIVTLMLTDRSFRYKRNRRDQPCTITLKETNEISEVIFSQIKDLSDTSNFIGIVIELINSIREKLNKICSEFRNSGNCASQRIQILMCCAYYYYIKNNNLNTEQLNELFINANYFSTDSFYKISILKIFMRYTVNLDVYLLINFIKKLDCYIYYYCNYCFVDTNKCYFGEKYIFLWDDSNYITNLYMKCSLNVHNIIFKIFIDYIISNKQNYYETLKIYLSNISTKSVKIFDQIYYNDIYRIIVNDLSMLQIHNPKDIIHILKKMIRYPESKTSDEETFQILSVLDDSNILDICTTAISNENMYKFDFERAYDLLKFQTSRDTLQQFCEKHYIKINVDKNITIHESKILDLKEQGKDNEIYNIIVENLSSYEKSLDNIKFFNTCDYKKKYVEFVKNKFTNQTTYLKCGISVVVNLICDVLLSSLSDKNNLANNSQEKQENDISLLEPNASSLTNCVCCFDNEKRICLIPCGHKCLCFNCTMTFCNNDKFDCLICRTKVTSFVIVYES